jgi:hypothetical protein
MFWTGEHLLVALGGKLAVVLENRQLANHLLQLRVAHAK